MHDTGAAREPVSEYNPSLHDNLAWMESAGSGCWHIGENLQLQALADCEHSPETHGEIETVRAREVSVSLVAADHPILIGHDASVWSSEGPT